VVGGIQSAKASYESPYGTIKSEWVDSENQFELKVEIPVNTTVVVVLPAKDISSVSESDVAIKENVLFKIVKEGGKISIEAGSGNYLFKVIKD